MLPVVVQVDWPHVAHAQQATPVIGYIGTGSRESDAFRLPSFHQGLSETGYVEGQNVMIEYRWAEAGVFVGNTRARRF